MTFPFVRSFFPRTLSEQERKSRLIFEEEEEENQKFLDPAGMNNAIFSLLLSIKTWENFEEKWRGKFKTYFTSVSSSPKGQQLHS